MTIRDKFFGCVAVGAAILALAGCGNGAPANSTSGTSGSSGSANGGGCSAAVQTTSVGEAGCSVPGTVGATIDSSDQLQWTPNTVTITAGQVVKFTNPASNSVTHNVTINGQPKLSSSNDYLAPGTTWEVKFTQAGTYPFQCTIHSGMSGTITVKAG